MSEYMKHIMEIEKIKKESDELMMKKIDHYEKEIALVREDAQVQILTLEKLVNARNSRIVDLTNINEKHKKINGDLRQLNNELIKDSENLQEKLSKYEDKAAHYRRKAIL
jgi:hypothetical protein